MSQYSRDRESRRRQRSVSAAVFLLLVGLALGVKVGFPLALGGVIVMLALAFGLPALVSARHRSAESRKRNQGGVPSWPARLSAGGASRSGFHFKIRVNPDSELLGRLYFDGRSWTWRAARTITRSYGIHELSWDSSWSMVAEPTWGPGKQGHVQLTRDGDYPVDLWVRGVDDLMRTCRSAGR